VAGIIHILSLVVVNEVVRKMWTRIWLGLELKTH